MALPNPISRQQVFGRYYAPLQLDSQGQWNKGSVAQSQTNGNGHIFDWVDDAGMTHEPAYETPADVGLAAGRLYIEGLKLTVDGEESIPPYISSGMCFERRYFFTTSEFAETDSDTFGELMSENNELVKLSIAQGPLDTRVDTSFKQAYLLHYDDVSGISYFELQHGEEDWEHWVRISQLEYPIEVRHPHIWSVGFAASLEVDPKYYEDYWMAFSTLLDRENLLENFDVRDNHEPPDFNQLFHPHRRVMLSGSMVRQIEPSKFEHSIPGWYGMDGSMICRSVQRGSEPIRQRVIGLFKGSNTLGLHNCMLPFTLDTIDQFQSLAFN